MPFQSKTTEPTPNNTSTPEEKVYPNFAQFFTSSELEQVKELAELSLKRILQSKSFVKKEFLIQIIRKETPIDIQNKAQYDLLLQKTLEDLDLASLGNSNLGWITQKNLLHSEKEMLDLATHVTKEHILAKHIVEGAIARKKGISEEQTDAVWAACDSEQRVTVIEGAAGAGKSFTMQAIKEAFIESGYNILGAALSWNAAKVLETSAFIPNCESIEGLIRKIEQTKKTNIEFFRKPTLLIVDEAGLVGTRHMHKLLKLISQSPQKIKVVLTGDSTQLSPVDAGSALEAIVDHCGSTKIDTIRRQKQESHRRAVRLFSTGDAGKGLYVYQQQEMINWSENKNDLFNKIVTDYISYKLAFPNKKSLLLALSNKDVQTLNQLIRECYKNLGFIAGKEYPIQLTDGERSWQSSIAVGDLIAFRKNDKKKVIYQEHYSGTGNPEEKSTGLFNRTTGVIQSIEERNSAFYIKVKLDGGGTVIVDTIDYMTDKGFPICHNFATTIYASQGQTVEKAFIVDSAMMHRRLAYVGMSRHTEHCEVYLNVEDLSTRIDKMLGVVGGNYSYKEMLQMVATTWAKESKNQTSTMMLKERWQKKEKETLSITLEPDEKISNYVDFIPEINKVYPKIDLDKLLNTPPEEVKNEIQTEENVKSSTETSVAPIQKPEKIIAQIEPPVVDTKNKVTQLPTSDKKTQADLSPLMQDLLFGSNFISTKESLKSSFLGFFRKNNSPSVDHNPAPQRVYTSNPVSIPVASSYFKKPLSVSTSLEPKINHQEVAVLKTAVIVPKLRNDIQYLPTPQTIAYYDFTQDKLIINGTGKRPSDEFLKATKGKYWEVGKYGEMKILSVLNHKVISRYSLDGTDNTKMFFPSLIANPQANDKTPIFIISNALDMLYTLEVFQKTKEIKASIPHFVWAAKEADFKHIIGGLRKRNIVIARSKTDDSQIPWALETEKKLNELGVNPQIIPKVPPEMLVSQGEANSSTQVKIENKVKI